MFSVHDGPILELQNVSFRYPGNDIVIKDLTFSARNGEFIGLLGANGSGKSTIMKLAGGILRPENGSVSLWGKPLQTYRNRDRAKLISYFPQTFISSVPFTVREIAGMGRYPYDIPHYITVEEAIEAVGLGDNADVPVGNLSGGEQRRAFIAMTLVQGAGILLLDEPLSNLDIKYQIDLLRLLKELQGKHSITVIMALHDINVALQFDKVMLIKGGNILGIGPPLSVLGTESIRTAFGVHVEIKRDDQDRSFISYGDIVS